MIGKEILNYTIVSLIGKGGMGSVYLAQNKYIQQNKVAVKVINSNMINDFTRQTFAKEADRLARLNHPNIVHFINYHIDDAGNIYLIMEYADGCSLEDYIKNVSGLIVEEKICQFFEPLLDAFEYAHKHKVIHKDIKPSNIIITTEGTPKILDFGIAALLDERSDDSDKDVIMGTPSYMSPEQVKGAALDQRSDIYSLGVLLHQMLTGNPPYDTTTLTEYDIYKNVVENQLPRMKTYYKYVSDKVQNVVDKATAKKPEDRYQSCQDFKKALHNAIYPPRIPVWSKVAAGVAAAVVLVAGFFVWDYNRVKVTYYKDYVEQWGVPQGIGKLSSSERKHVHRMYRFESRHYKLQRMSHVNSIGTIIGNTESEMYDRPLDIEFFYSEDNRLTRAKVKDHNGQVLYIKSYNDKLNTVIFQFDDEFGTEKTIGNETVGYVDAFGSDQARGKISRYLLEYDENGYVKRLRYAGFQNVYVGDANGIYGKQYVRDEKGRVVEEMYLAHDGSPKATKWGMGKKIFAYDENDNWISARYETVDGEPSLDDFDGTSVCENEYDSYGNQIAQYYKTAEGNLMVTAKHGCSGVRTEYDDRGYIVEQRYLGIDGNVAMSLLNGYAIITTEVDEYGFFNCIRYFDADRNPCLTEQGYSKSVKVNDSRGNELEEWNYGLDGELVHCKDGYAGLTAEYDSLGHCSRITFFDKDREPVLLSTGVAAFTREYNSMGDMIKESYLDTEGKPVKNNNNIATVVYERDIRGNITKLLYYDESGEPILSDEGIAGADFVYDDNGNEIRRSFFNKEGKPTKGYLGFASRQHTYDGNGNMLTDRYLDVNGKYILVDGVAGFDYKLDARGNIIEEIPVGTDGKLASGKLLTRYKYDEKDNVIELAYFNSAGKPAVNALHYHRETSVYNTRNQCVESCYYDANGNLTEYDDNNYSILRIEYDERGQVVKVSYFDEDDKPTTYSGDYDGDYSSRTSEYDNYGRVIRQRFFDRDGAPTDPKVMVPEGVVEYDKWGNVIYLAAMDGNGNLIKNPKTGYAVQRYEYDSNQNCLWYAYFDENDSPTLIEGYHKVVNTYINRNSLESSSYFGKDGSPVLYSGYHCVKYKYDENNNQTEIAYFGKNGKPVNNSYGVCKITMTYAADGTPKEKKFYNLSGNMLLHEQYVNGNWVTVVNWRANVLAFDDLLPQDLGSDSYNLVLKSCRTVSSNRVEVLLVTPMSKYDMSVSYLNIYKSICQGVPDIIRSQLDIPGSVAIWAILKDSKGRELYKYKK